MRADEHRPPEGSADMLGIVATIKVKPGTGEQLEAAAA
jgi:hypothetical protein